MIERLITILFKEAELNKSYLRFKTESTNLIMMGFCLILINT